MRHQAISWLLIEKRMDTLLHRLVKYRERQGKCKTRNTNNRKREKRK